ncbi:MAG: polysaccharide biosynthesis/export family protein, partial [Bacteroidota bacterium]
MVLVTILLSVLLGSGCQNRTRNVLFNTPKRYQKMNVAVVHLNADTTADNELYQHRIQADDRIAIRFLNNFDISERITMTQQGGGESGISFLVDKTGHVSLPMLGKVYLEGMTKAEAQVALE